MNFTTNWRDRRSVFGPSHYSIANYGTDSKTDMLNTFGDELFLKNLPLIPDPLKKNLADTLITEEPMTPKTKVKKDKEDHNKPEMNMQSDYSPLSGITNFFSGVMNVISNAMFSMRKQPDNSSEDGRGMAVPSMWHGAKILDENKTLQDENSSNDRAAELLVTDMSDCRAAVAHCQSKIEQVRILLASKPVPCAVRVRRRPKKAFIEAGLVEDSFEDAFSPEDFENLANNSLMEYYSPVSNHEHNLHEIDGPKVQTKMATPEILTGGKHITESTEIVKPVPEIVQTEEKKSLIEEKKELVASCEDKLSKLKALLQERKKKSKITIEPEVEITPPVPQKPLKIEKELKAKDKRYKNPKRSTNKRRKCRMRKNISDDLTFAHEIHSEDLSSSVDNSPSINMLENYLPHTKKEFFNEVSGCFLPSSTDSEECFQIVFNDEPKVRRQSDCDSEDSFIVFEDSPDSCYTSNDVFGDSTDSEDYDSDSDLSDSGCGTFNLASSLSKSLNNLADDSLYEDRSEDEVDCVVTTVPCVDETTVSRGLLIDERKKLMRKGQPVKRVQFSSQPPKVHVMRVWAFAARQARCGNWTQYSLDRDRFKRRIADVDMAVSWVLKPQHRARVMFQRFMPWWNAQKRLEAAEKRERDAQEKLKREEDERLKAELESREVDNEVAEVGVDSDRNTKVNFIVEDNKGDNCKTEDVKKDVGLNSDCLTKANLIKQENKGGHSKTEEFKKGVGVVSNCQTKVHLIKQDNKRDHSKTEEIKKGVGVVSDCKTKVHLIKQENKGDNSTLEEKRDAVEKSGNESFKTSEQINCQMYGVKEINDNNVTAGSYVNEKKCDLVEKKALNT